MTDMMNRSKEFYQELVKSLAALPTETEWVEFKLNNKDPVRIAKYISGLSNVATLCDRPCAYIVWGINDASHAVEGTRQGLCIAAVFARKGEAGMTK